MALRGLHARRGKVSDPARMAKRIMEEPGRPVNREAAPPDRLARMVCMDNKELMALASEAATRSYSPYSKFRVGAALLCADGSVFMGTNIENRSFGLTVCAERNAFGAAVGAGKRRFTALAIACPDADYPVSPCGACRQVISEFVGADFPVAFSCATGETVRTTAGELFPYDALHELSGNDAK